MEQADILKRIDELLALTPGTQSAPQLSQGCVSLLSLVYGPNSSQLQQFNTALSAIHKGPGSFGFQSQQIAHAAQAFSGLRRSEIQGLRWSDYNGSELRVQRSVWEGITDDTKTDASNGVVAVISALARRLDRYRAMARPAPEAPMFAASNGKPLRLNNVLRSRILPGLNRCATCGESEEGHTGSDHEHSRDGALPEWKGWHGFRRGLATNLHDLGIDDHTIKAILRHSSVTVTQRSYIKSLPKQSVAAMNTFDSSVAALVHERDMNPGKGRNRLVN